MLIPRPVDQLPGHLSAMSQATTRALLLADGFTDDQIAQAVATGTLIRVRRGAFVGGATASWRPETRHACAAVAVARGLAPDVALSHASALAVWRLPVVKVPLTGYHVVQPGRPAKSLRTGLVRHVCPDNVSIKALTSPQGWAGTRVVSRAVAIAQVACAHGVDTALPAADAALRAGRVTRDELTEAPAQCGLRHVTRATTVAALADPLAESPGESLTRLELLRLGLEPRAQVEVRDARGFVGRVDLLVDDIVVEFDGRVKYEGADARTVFAQEKVREDRLRAAGYRVVRIVWKDLLTPGAVRAKLGAVRRLAA